MAKKEEIWKVEFEREPLKPLIIQVSAREAKNRYQAIEAACRVANTHDWYIGSVLSVERH